jgi:hypothetical protein
VELDKDSPCLHYQSAALAGCDAVKLCQATADNFRGLTCEVLKVRVQFFGLLNDVVSITRGRMKAGRLIFNTVLMSIRNIAVMTYRILSILSAFA